MSTKNIKEKQAKKEAERALEDVKLYRLMIEFGLAIVLIFLMIAGENNGLALMPKAMGALVIVSGVLFAASALFYTFNKKKSGDESLKVITKAGIFGNAAVLFFACAHFYLFWDAQMLTVAVIAALVLYLVHNIYGGSYFAYSLVAGAGFAALQTAEKSGHTITTLSTLVVNLAIAAAFIIPAAAIVFALIKIAGKKVSAKILVGVIPTAAIILAGAVLAIVNPAAVVYAIFALIAFYLVSTVAYTVKMM